MPTHDEDISVRKDRKRAILGEQLDEAAIAHMERVAPTCDFQYVDGKLVAVPAPTAAR